MKKPYTIRNCITSLFQRRKKHDAGKSERPPPKSQNCPDSPRAAGAACTAANARSRQDLEAMLAQLVSRQTENADVAAGKVNLLNIEAIREQMGDQWAKFSDRIHGIIKAELKERLGPGSFFTQADGDSYVVVFGESSDAEARLKFAVILLDI